MWGLEVYMTFDLSAGLMVMNFQVVDILDEAQWVFTNLHCMQCAILCIFVEFIKSYAYIFRI